MHDFMAIAAAFSPEAPIKAAREYGNGNVNDTFLVTLGSVEEGQAHRFILQRINTRVFRRPDLVMGNMRIATDHIRKKLESQPLVDGRRWERVRILSTGNGCDHLVDGDGGFWRAISFIDGVSFDTIESEHHAEEVGYALGMFQGLISDLTPQQLADTLEGFHITPRYLQRWDEVSSKSTLKRNTPEFRHAMRFVQERRGLAHVLEDARRDGLLRLRPIHGDPKVNNVMIDPSTGQAIGMIDLDTVKPGLVHYDIGDCLRSGCNPLGEEVEEWRSVGFEPELSRSILRGYFSVAAGFLSEQDCELVYDAIRLIAFELGLRFLTDYLEGNVYFKARHKEHNLTRALVQFELTRSIEAQEKSIRAIVHDLRGTAVCWRK